MNEIEYNGKIYFEDSGKYFEKIELSYLEIMDDELIQQLTNIKYKGHNNFINNFLKMWG